MVLQRGELVGVLVPGLLFGRAHADQIRVIGPKGNALGTLTFESLWTTVLAVGGVLFGKPDEVKRVAEGLEAPETSRNFSYLTCICADCASILRVHDKYSSSSVAVIGCGGIGSITAILLAGAGLKSMRLVDGDVVEASNLNRQLLYSLSDVGRAKVEVTASQIRARFPQTSVSTVCERVEKERLNDHCRGADAILMTADEPLHLLHAVSAFAEQQRLPVVVAGYSVEQGMVTSEWKPATVDREFADSDGIRHL